MNVFAAFLSGLQRAVAHPLLIVLKWLMNLLTAYVLTIPIRNALADTLDHSLTAVHWAENVSLFDNFRFWMGETERWEAVFPLQMVIVVLFALANLFLSGGILDAMQRSHRLSSSALLQACGSRFLPLLLVAACALLWAFVVVVAPFVGLNHAFDALEGGFAGPKYRYWMFWIGAIFILVFGLSHAWRVYDFARARVCQRGEDGLYPSIFHAFISGLVTATRYYWSSLILWAAYVGLLLLLIPLAQFWRGVSLPLAAGSPLLETLSAQLIVVLQIAIGLAMPMGAGTFADARRQPGREPRTKPTIDNPEGEPQITSAPLPAAVAASIGVEPVLEKEAVAEAVPEPKAFPKPKEESKENKRKHDPHMPPDEEIDFDDDAYEMWADD